MKLLCLNLWGGRVREPLLEFLKQYNDVDIFCFQKIYNNAPFDRGTATQEPDLQLLTSLRNLLPGYQDYFRPVIEKDFGIAIFIKRGIQVLTEDSAFIYENPHYSGKGGDHSRNVQWATIQDGEKAYHVFNIHALWNGKGKGDAPERIEQSMRIKKLMSAISGPKILCGDFNVNPDTQSLHLLENGMINLIKTHGITSTRTRFYEKEIKFADYMLVSPDINVLDFKLLPDEVSDHAPLYLEFE